AEVAAVERSAGRKTCGALCGSQWQGHVRQRQAAELRLAELELATRIDGLDHLERQIDRVERALVGGGVGCFLRRRQIPIDVDVVDREIVGESLTFERDASGQRRVVE